MNKPSSTIHLSDLIEKDLIGLSPIQTIMKMAEKEQIIKLGLDPSMMISFGGGWCNHLSPKLLRECYLEIINDNTLFHKSGRYSPIRGQYECMKQLCLFEKEIYNIPDLTPDNLLIGHSSTQLMHDILRVIQNPGSPVCVLDPTYANYFNTVKCALPKSSIDFIPALDPTSWEYLSDPQQSLDILQDMCKKGAKTFIMPIPDNPTSQIPSDDFVKAANEIIEENQSILILDFAYKALWFERVPDCYRWSPNQYNHVIAVHSHSKWLSSLGRRFGWIEAHPSIIHGVEKLTESTVLSPDSLHTMVTTRFLEKSSKSKSLKSFIEKTRLLYKKTSDVLIDQINKHLGWKYLKPQGGLYTICPTPGGEDPVQFVERILKHTGVLLIPGNGFGPSMDHAVRISYGPLCYQHDLIKRGIEKISAYLS
jgi:aspartate/methionine/tyrosine aminotransferase